MGFKSVIEYFRRPGFQISGLGLLIGGLGLLIGGLGLLIVGLWRLASRHGGFELISLSVGLKWFFFLVCFWKFFVFLGNFFDQWW